MGYVNESTCKILIGNKCDLTAERQVSTEEAKKKDEELGIEFIEASAKDATNVETAFQIVSAKLIEKREQDGNKAGHPGVGPLTRNGTVKSSGCAGCGSGGSNAEPVA